MALKLNAENKFKNEGIESSSTTSPTTQKKKKEKILNTNVDLDTYLEFREICAQYGILPAGKIRELIVKYVRENKHNF